MPKCGILAVVGLAGVVAAGVLPRPAAAQGAPSTHPLFGRYCVTCHNDRLQTGGLSLEHVDAGEVGANAEVLEKVIRKLRDGLMPPAGRPRPEAAVVDEFVTRLETSLDAAAASGGARAGWVASRRLNRTEYVNAVHDLLALEIDGDALLPSDLAGFGFDNNADALTITPALMSRYMTAAMRISRMALGSPENRPAGHVYEVRPTARQDARMGENMPFATHGGVAVRHNFPLDGEYVFRLRLKRGSGGVAGIEEDEHQIELRVDHELIERFTIGGRYRGLLNSGTMVAIDEDDVLGQQVHEYLMHADDDLEARVRIEAGTRTVAAAFTDSLPSAVNSGSPVGVDQLEISGPFNGSVPDETPSRRRVLVCRPAATSAAAADESCAREIIQGLARRAYRRPLTGSDVEPLLDLYRAGRSDGGFEAGIGLALEGVLSSPHFLIRVESDPDGVAPGTVYRLSDVELASRLSFFLWRSIPDDELLDLAAEGRLSEPATLSEQVRRMLGDRRATRFMDDFVEQWLQVRNLRSHEPDRRLFRGFDPTLRDAMVRETKLFFESQVRGGQADSRAAARRLHVPERAPGAALRDRRRLRESPAPRDPGRRPALRAARARQRPHRHLVSEPDVGRAAREVDPGKPAGVAAPAAPAERAGARGERGRRGARIVAGAHGAASRQPGLRQLSQPDRSVGLRAGALRCGRRVARDRRGRGHQRHDRAVR